MDSVSAAPTPATYDSVPSSTSNSPEPNLDDDYRDPLIPDPEDVSSQSSYSGSTSHATSRNPSPQRERDKPPIEWLPNELLICIFSKLAAPDDLYKCVRVNRLWARCCVDLLWHRPLFTSWERLMQVAAALQSPRPYWHYADLIRRLNLSNLTTEISDGTLQPFAACKRIERLTLTGCSNLSDSGITALVDGNRSLLALDITGIGSITDMTVQTLARSCPRLQGLNVTMCQNITDESLVPLARSCKYLKRVRLLGTPFSCLLLTSSLA